MDVEGAGVALTARPATKLSKPAPDPTSTTRSLDDAAAYPLFTPDLIDLMRTLLDPDRQAEVATVVTLTARRPADA